MINCNGVKWGKSVHLTRKQRIWYYDWKFLSIQQWCSCKSHFYYLAFNRSSLKIQKWLTTNANKNESKCLGRTISYKWSKACFIFHLITDWHRKFLEWILNCENYMVNQIWQICNRTKYEYVLTCNLATNYALDYHKFPTYL